MSRGGSRPNTKVESNYLFKPKWNNKKTTAIRIPEVFKSTLLEIARYLDNAKISNLENKEIIDDFINCSRHKKLWSQYKERLIELRQEKKELLKDNNELIKEIKQRNNQDNYQIAQKCFEEYIKSQNLNMGDLSISRKGSKKHQLFEINQWFENQHSIQD